MRREPHQEHVTLEDGATESVDDVSHWMKQVIDSPERPGALWLERRIDDWAVSTVNIILQTSATGITFLEWLDRVQLTILLTLSNLNKNYHRIGSVENNSWKWFWLKELQPWWFNGFINSGNVYEPVLNQLTTNGNDDEQDTEMLIRN